jgi:hypothetical protein
MKLTKKEREQVLAAAEIIENYQAVHSCVALSIAESGRAGLWDQSELVSKYAEFYEQYASDWFGSWGHVIYDLKEVRVLMLLTFAEVCK